jgi:hypothetical protein
MLEPLEPQTQKSNPLPSGRDSIEDLSEWKIFVDDLKRQWKHLWLTRIDDKEKAEGIASNEFPKLFVDKGTIIMATRDFHPPDLQEILEKHMSKIIADKVNPRPTTGGIGKFIKEIKRNQQSGRRQPPEKPNNPKNQQLKHGGKGWLHYSSK